MPRPPRIAPGGMIFHVLNRGVRRMRLFETYADYAAFVNLLGKIQQETHMRICAYCIMPNHWHMVLWPESDGDLTKFMYRLTMIHTIRWQTRKQTLGYGHLYQGRYKSFPICGDTYFYRAIRYVERNPLSSNLVLHAEEWRWSSLWQRVYGATEGPLLCEWPDPIPNDWIEQANTPMNEEELSAIRHSVKRGTPYGNADWVQQVTQQLALQQTVRKRGRPAKTKGS